MSSRARDKELLLSTSECVDNWASEDAERKESYVCEHLVKGFVKEKIYLAPQSTLEITFPLSAAIA